MEILGLLDTLEAMILDGFKIPLSSKTIVNEEKLLAVIDKVRLVLQGGEDFAKKAIGREKHLVTKAEVLDEVIPKKGARLSQKAKTEPEDIEGKAIEVLQQAYQVAKEVRQGADKYADEVLANLEATSARILRSIRAGRERLSRVVGEGHAEEPKSIADVLKKEEKGEKEKAKGKEVSE
jgi:hypothetical protein